MNNQKISGFFVIFTGLLMFGMWSFLILTNQVPFLGTPQVEIKLHIITELLTASLLIIGGIFYLKDRENFSKIHFVSQGMLLYAILNSSGYYIDLGEIAIVIMFILLLLGTLISIIYLT